MRADVLNIELRRLCFADTGVLGAAILAGAGVGLFESVPQAARRMVTVEQVFRPDPGRRERYDRLLALYLETYHALKPIYQRMIRRVP
nr:hypothetical protein [Kineobactrum salinum]